MKTLTHDGHCLEIDSSTPGGECYLDGNRIPSARIWDAIFEGNIAPKNLVTLAQEAEIYRTEKQRVFRASTNSEGDTILTTDEENIRPRPVMRHFNLHLGTISRSVEDRRNAFLGLVALANEHGCIPVARVDRLVFFIEGDEDARQHLYNTGGCADWLRLGVLAKRPGSVWYRYGLPARTFEEKDHDGVVMISDDIAAPMQGTGVISTANDRVHLVKGIIRPPFPGETPATVSTDAFKRPIENALYMDFYPLRQLDSERCRLNMQTAFFSLADPVSFIENDTDRLEGKTFVDFLSREDQLRVSYGVSASLLRSAMSPLDILTRFHAPGIRATVYSDASVPCGCFRLLPGSYEALKSAVWRYDKKLGKLLRGGKSIDPVELEDIGLEWLLHRDPAMPDGSSMFRARLDGGTTLGDAPYGIVINPFDPQWRSAGGDFDGDAGNIYINGPGMEPRKAVLWENMRTDGVARGADVDSEMLNSYEDGVGGLLAPIIALCTRLAERGYLTDKLRAIGAAVAQASVDAKKHDVDSKAVHTASDAVFQATSDAFKGVPFLGALINALKRCGDDRARAAAWRKVAQWDRSNASPIERAMIRRIEILWNISEDMNFLRQLQHPELPENMRSAAMAKTTPESLEYIQMLVDRYRQCREALNEATNVGIKDVAEDAKDALRRAMRALSYSIEHGSEANQMAAIAIAPAKIAAQHVPSSTFKQLNEGMTEGLVNLVGSNFKNAIYYTRELKPVPNCLSDFKAVTEGSEKVRITVKHITPSGHSTRVLITANATGETTCQNSTFVI